jgi:hypothetical protein
MQPLNWNLRRWASWCLIALGGSLVATALLLALRNDDATYPVVILGVPLGLIGIISLARDQYRELEPGSSPVTTPRQLDNLARSNHRVRPSMAANLLLIGFALIGTVLMAVLEQGRSLWLLPLPLAVLGLGVYALARSRS